MNDKNFENLQERLLFFFKFYDLTGSNYLEFKSLNLVIEAARMPYKKIKSKQVD